MAVPNPVLRHKVWRGLNTDEVAEPNAFAIDAAIAAFTEGANWLDALRGYILENKNAATKYIQEQVPQMEVVPSQATYLLWLHCGGMVGLASEAAEYIRQKTGLYLSAGNQFGAGGGDFLRMNIACPQEVLEDGLHRLKEGIAAYEEFVINRC